MPFPSLRILAFTLLFIVLAWWLGSALLRITEALLKPPAWFNPFAISACTAGFFVHVGHAARGRWWIVYIATGTALEVARVILLLPHMPWQPALWHGAGLYLGLSAAILTGARVAVYAVSPARRAQCAWLASIAFWTLLIQLAAFDSMFWLTKLSQASLHYDRALYLVDEALGVNVSVELGKYVLRKAWLSQLVWGIYLWLPAGLMGVYALQLHYRPGDNAHVLRAALIVCAFMVLYVIVPACGPLVAFRGAYPYAMPSPANAAALHRLDAPRYCLSNTVPSLHVVWALIVLYHARLLPWWARLAAWVFFILTLVGTLGVGNHYLVDIIIAFPLALLVHALSGPLRPGMPRWRNPSCLGAAGVGLALVALWLAVLRLRADLLYDNPPLLWVLVLLTFGLYSFFKRALDRQAV